MSGLFAELKRRNVFRVGIAYLMLGWVVVQITDVVVPALNLPATLNSIVVYIGIVGFPFALFFAWAFELTPDGLKPSNEVPDEQSSTSDTGRKIERMALVLLIIAVGLMAWDGYLSDEPVADAPSITPANASIAVLPFVNMSADPDQEYFSDGISEEILNVLAKIPDLRVTSRSSAFSFKGKEIIISDVAEQLGVATVLEGSVRKAGTKVRITAQLIQADGDIHLWSDTYDRELDDIFAIQDEISEAIVEELKEHLGLEQETQLASNDGLSQNTQAYEAYLKAHHQILMRTNGSINGAVELLKYALDLDPDFALAHAELAIAYSLLIDSQYGEYTYDEVLELGLPHADKAMEIAPDHPMSLAAAGFVIWDRFPSQQTIDYFEKSLEINPSDGDVLGWLANSYGRIGEYKKSMDLQEKILKIDPLNIPVLGNTIGAYSSNNDFEEAEKLLERLSSFSQFQYFQSLGVIQRNKGLFAEASKNIIHSLSLEPKNGLTRIRALFSLVTLGLFEEAIVIIPDFKAEILLIMENFEEAIQVITSEETHFSSDEKEIFLGNAYARLGNYDQALPLLEKQWIKGGKRMTGNGPSSMDMQTLFALAKSRQALNPNADVSDLLEVISNDKNKMIEADLYEPLISYMEASEAFINGDIDFAVSKYEVASERKLFYPPQFGDVTSALNEDPRYVALREKAEAQRNLQRDIFLNELCKSNPYSNVLTLLPETCVGYN